MSERHYTKSIEYTEDEYLEKNIRLLELDFTSGYNLIIHFGYDNKHRLDFSYVSGLKFGIKHTEFITITLLNKTRKTYMDESTSYHIVQEVLLSPLDVKKALNVLKRFYKNTKAGKQTIVKPLTEEEIEDIVIKMNMPLPEQGVLDV